MYLDLLVFSPAWHLSTAYRQVFSHPKNSSSHNIKIFVVAQQSLPLFLLCYLFSILFFNRNHSLAYLFDLRLSCCLLHSNLIALSLQKLETPRNFWRWSSSPTILDFLFAEPTVYIFWIFAFLLQELARFKESGIKFFVCLPGFLCDYCNNSWVNYHEWSCVE